MDDSLLSATVYLLEDSMEVYMPTCLPGIYFALNEKSLTHRGHRVGFIVIYTIRSYADVIS